MKKHGTLDTKFPEEMLPEKEKELVIKNQHLISYNGVAASHIENIPMQCRITLEIEPTGPNEEYGLILRSDSSAANGYRLNFSAANKIVSLGNTNIKGVDGLNKPIKIDIILKDDIIDVCIDKRRCIVNRTPEQKGTFAWFYAKHGNVTFKSIKINN